MSLFATHHPCRALLGAALTAGVLLGGSLAVNTAHAAIACRADPVVTLSNGVTLQISEDIAADASQVAAIAYVVHAPAGTQLLSVTYTAGAIGTKEKLKVTTDAPAGTYTSDTDVSVAIKGTSITGTTVVSQTANPSAPTATASFSGLSSQHMLATVAY